MLVDDEEEVRQAIIKKLDWEAMGFRLVASADNGEEALEMAEKYHPDVVMTDIHMPFMDGLTLCRKLKENFKNIKLVIFSGYDEFEYAKEAIKLEVEEYILKPINAQELQQVFERLKSALDEEINEKRNIDKLKQYYLESLPKMRDQFFIGLLEGGFSEDKIAEYQAYYDIIFDAPYYNVAVLRVDTNIKEEAESNGGVIDSKLRVVSAKQIVEENMSGVLPFYSCIYLDTIIVIAMMSDTKDESIFVHTMDQICKIIKKIVGYDASAGIGSVSSSPLTLGHSYEGAKSALEYRILLEPNQAICIQDIEPDDKDEFAIKEWVIESIIKEIKVGTQEGLKELIEQLEEQLKNSKMSIHQLQLAVSEFIIEIVKLARVYKLDMDEILGAEYSIFSTVNKFHSLDTLKEWLYDICMQLRGQIRRERVDSTKLLTDKAIQYIQENFHDSELSVDKLCNYLNVSPAYFSTIFKKETGMSFVSYLTNIRMEQALHLLNTTEEKAYVISCKVGYLEPNYFSYVFKKQYGISPSKYRTTRAQG
jgi:two-component system response regulator YesN